MDRRKLIDRLNEDEEMTDKERREEYFAEIENDRQYQEWKDRGGTN
jgi:hypothetical protein